MQLAISCEGWFGLDWPQWRPLVETVERLGFAGLYLSDHILIGAASPYPSLELIVALTYLADHTERVRFGALVSPLSVREPVTLARQAAALDNLSGGRFVLGVGAGWNAGEHTMFGYALGDLPTRFARLEEGLEVLTRLLRGNGPANYAGRFFQLQDASLAPRPQRPGSPPILIGGKGPRRTLPLVARYADIWNAQGVSPAQVRERAALLDRLLAAGRSPPRGGAAHHDRAGLLRAHAGRAGTPDAGRAPLAGLGSAADRAVDRRDAGSGHHRDPKRGRRAAARLRRGRDRGGVGALVRRGGPRRACAPGDGGPAPASPRSRLSPSRPRTAHRHLPLWTLDEGDWLQVLRVPAYAPRQRRHTSRALRA